MIRALKLADEKYGFRHYDLDYRNCLILENGTPVIIDFGQSEIGKQSESQCKDISAFLNSVLKNSYCNSNAILDKKYPGIDKAAKEKKINNCKKIFANITFDGKGKKLLDFIYRCNPHNGTDINFDDFYAKIVELLSS
jgi:tRNA A-37 threonylcarbamoyl transferase component Bud32